MFLKFCFAFKWQSHISVSSYKASKDWRVIDLFLNTSQWRFYCIVHRALYIFLQMEELKYEILLPSFIPGSVVILNV